MKLHVHEHSRSLGWKHRLVSLHGYVATVSSSPNIHSVFQLYRNAYKILDIISPQKTTKKLFSYSVVEATLAFYQSECIKFKDYFIFSKGCRIMGKHESRIKSVVREIFKVFYNTCKFRR